MASRVTASIDVIIPTFGRWDLTERCLKRLREQTAAHRLFVVDNGSTDGTPERISADFPEVELLALGENLGFPVACNRGVAAGAGEIVVLLNNDVEARPDFLEALVGPFGDATVGTAAALLVRPGERDIDCLGLCVDRTLAGFPRLRGLPVSEAAAVAPVLAGPCGGGGAYRRIAWEQAGGLDEGVRFYGEDVDLALRIRAAGWNAVGVPDAIAVHHGSATAGNRSSWQRFQGGFARGYFLRRYRVVTSGAGPRALATEALVIVGDSILSRDLSALRGRLAGWRAARGTAPRQPPPEEAIDPSIRFADSLRLRRVVYLT